MCSASALCFCDQTLTPWDLYPTQEALSRYGSCVSHFSCHSKCALGKLPTLRNTKLCLWNNTARHNFSLATVSRPSPILNRTMLSHAHARTHNSICCPSIRLVRTLLHPLNRLLRVRLLLLLLISRIEIREPRMRQSLLCRAPQLWPDLQHLP